MFQTIYLETTKQLETTNSAATGDWLKVAEEMAISAYVEPQFSTSKLEDKPSEERLFGTYLRELKEDIKNFLKL